MPLLIGLHSQIKKWKRGGGIEPLDFRPTVYRRQLRRLMWERLAQKKCGIPALPRDLRLGAPASCFGTNAAESEVGTEGIGAPALRVHPPPLCKRLAAQAGVLLLNYAPAE